jgi:hypothetical protein
MVRGQGRAPLGEIGLIFPRLAHYGEEVICSDHLAYGCPGMKRQRKEKGYFLILFFLDEKKQKSSDYRIS